MSALSSSLRATAAVNRAAGAADPKAASPFKRAVAEMREWQRRSRSRRELAELSAVELRDIGYPAATKAEIAKPFWRR